MLPVLSNNTVSTLTLLERNLTKFNASFGNTIVKLDEKLSKVGETYGQQLEILRRIEKLDMSKMATANVKILKALDSSSKISKTLRNIWIILQSIYLRFAS